MKKLLPILAALALSLLLPSLTRAQDRLNGEILDKDGKPWPGLTIQIKSEDTGQTVTTKTDKDGKFTQLGLRGGVYTVTVISEKENLNYPQKMQYIPGQENNFKLNFKEIIAANAAAHPEEVKKREEVENKNKMMQEHFQAGLAAMNDANSIAQQIKTAAADQKSSLQEKRVADCLNAANEFSQAEQVIDAKMVKNRLTVLGNMGIAYNCAGKYDESVAAYQKSIEVQPQAGSYAGMSMSIAAGASSITNPKALDAKAAEAMADCDKAAALDPAAGTACYRNLGIVFSNRGQLKQAVPPLQKATAADPKDAQGWFLLGGALASMADFKQEGDKQVAILAPGTLDAFQKCIDVDPNAPLAKTCKESLDQLNELAGGEATTIKQKKKKG
jgi:tetratricopeptide (TPR) repeat protein